MKCPKQSEAKYCRHWTELAPIPDDRSLNRTRAQVGSGLITRTQRSDHRERRRLLVTVFRRAPPEVEEEAAVGSVKFLANRSKLSKEQGPGHGSGQGDKDRHCAVQFTAIDMHLRVSCQSPCFRPTCCRSPANFPLMLMTVLFNNIITWR